MVRTLLIRGMLVGLVAGVVAVVIAKVLGERQVGHAIAFEYARATAEGAPEEKELVSRTVQSTAGLLTGVAVFGVAIGGLFSLAYACVQGRLGTLGARGTALAVAAGGFLGMYLLPDLKYPANPPSIGNPNTIGRRTALYFALMLISVVVVVGVAVAARRYAGRFGGWNAALLAGLGGIAVIAVAYVLLPRVDETPTGFPADVLWRFRLASLAIQVSLWTTLGLLFGALTERAARASLAGARGRTGAGAAAAVSAEPARA
jgi:hypothetical protein